MELILVLFSSKAMVSCLLRKGLLCGLFLFVLYGTSGVCPAAESTVQWKFFKTRYVNLLYTDTDHLKKLNKKIRYSPGGGSFASLFSSQDKAGWEEAFKDKINALFEKVQLILDMRKAIKKVKIMVFADPDSLHQKYFKIFKSRKAPRAWYIFKYNTIYINVKDIHEGMLAHEMAHAIIDNFMSVRPPRATAEILARYVDKNLFEEVKQY